MAKTRALMTELERERIAGDADAEPKKRYQAVSRVRNRIDDNLRKDVATLREHHPELFEELQAVVCVSD